MKSWKWNCISLVYIFCRDIIFSIPAVNPIFGQKKMKFLTVISSLSCQPLTMWNHVLHCFRLKKPGTFDVTGKMSVPVFVIPHSKGYNSNSSTPWKLLAQVIKKCIAKCKRNCLHDSILIFVYTPCKLKLVCRR